MDGVYDAVDNSLENKYRNNNNNLPKNSRISKGKKKRCKYCGFSISSESRICSGCGKQYIKPKNAILIFLLVALLVMSGAANIVQCIRNKKINSLTHELKENNLAQRDQIAEQTQINESLTQINENLGKEIARLNIVIANKDAKIDVTVNENEKLKEKIKDLKETIEIQKIMIENANRDTQPGNDGTEDKTVVPSGDASPYSQDEHLQYAHLWDGTYNAYYFQPETETLDYLHDAFFVFDVTNKTVKYTSGSYSYTFIITEIDKDWISCYNMNSPDVVYRFYNHPNGNILQYDGNQAMYRLVLERVS